MTLVQELQTIQNNLIASLGDVITLYNSVVADPKPNYTIDGRSISWSDYRKSLMDDIAELNKQIADLTKQISALSPYVISTKMVV